MITLNQHKAAITKRIITTFSDLKSPKMGLGAFFKNQTSSSKQVSLEVQRHRQLIAADVQRGTDANINTFENYSDKLYEPPMYFEGFNFSDLDKYHNTFGENNPPSENQAMQMVDQAMKKLEILKYKIQRAVELQRSQVLQTGVVTLNNGDNIDYNRQAESLTVLAAGNRWNEANTNPLTDLETGAQFLREQGLSAGAMVNVVFGRDALREFLNNQSVKDLAEIRRVERVSIGMPQFDGVTGMALQGIVSVYDFNLVLWTYSDFFELPDGTKAPYIDPRNVVMIAEDFEASTQFASVPAIVRDAANAEYPEFIQQVEAEYYINNYVDPRVMAHHFNIASAPLAIPYSIDRIYTIQALQ